MVTLKEWFEDKDYGIGLALLGTYSKNRILHQNLSRKCNPEKLEYALTQIAKQKGGVPAAEVTETDLPEAPTASLHDQAVDKLNEEHEKTIGEFVSGALKVIRGNREINYDDLTPEMKARWDQNRDSYKEIRALHEKLKLLEKATPEDRKPLTERITRLDDQIRTNWEVIDSFDPAAADSAAEVNKIDHKRIQANRKYISTNLKKLQQVTDPVKTAKIVSELQVRYNELNDSGEAVSAETMNDLRNAGVQC